MGLVDAAWLKDPRALTVEQGLSHHAARPVTCVIADHRAQKEGEHDQEDIQLVGEAGLLQSIYIEDILRKNQQQIKYDSLFHRNGSHEALLGLSQLSGTIVREPVRVCCRIYI